MRPTRRRPHHIAAAAESDVIIVYYHVLWWLIVLILTVACTALCVIYGCVGIVLVVLAGEVYTVV